jgi:hypothetical protein
VLSGLAWLDQTMTSARPPTSDGDRRRADRAARSDRAAKSIGGAQWGSTFILARRMTADGFYTSAISMRTSTKPTALRRFTVPAASIDHVPAGPLK